MNNELINRNKYIIIAIILIFGISAGILKYSWNKKEVNPTSSASLTAFVSPLNYSTPTPTPSIEKENNITYTTFSSSKADFTFEYPNMWVYDEKVDPNNPKATNWAFYIDPNHKTGIPAFAVVSPMIEGVDFCSGKASSRQPDALVKINTYKTNDPDTYITYEQCGDIKVGIGIGYIYWQKGKQFYSADDIKNIYQVNLMVFYFTPDLPKGSEIAQHIAQSIKVK